MRLLGKGENCLGEKDDWEKESPERERHGGGRGWDQGLPGAVAGALLTTAEPTMARQLEGTLWAVPAVPGKLVLAFFNATLGPSGHTAGVDQVSLRAHEPTFRPDVGAVSCPLTHPLLNVLIVLS